MQQPLSALLVEDEAILAMHLEECLIESGYDVVGIATTSEEAMQLARALKPDLAFLDIHLADGPTGVEVARAIAQDCGALVIFMTANEKLIPEDYAGAAGVIAKPYSQFGVVSALRFIEGCMSKKAAPGKPPPNFVVSPRYREAWGVAH